jgi:hypothetical protein
MRQVLLVAALAALCSCDDSTPTQRVQDDETASAQLVLSDDQVEAGQRLVVLVRVTAGAGKGPVATFTARLRYDASQLRLAGEHQLDRGATVVLNGNDDGVVRVAGFRSDGFSSGDLVAIAFVALSDHAVGTLELAFDELHAVGGEDLRSIARGGRVIESTLGQ